MKYFFGVMSKNQVDTVIKYSLDYGTDVTFIPSRRQVEFNGGYVNNWTTKSFSEYVKQFNSTIKIERDHSGQGQGLHDDDGYVSLEEDCKYFDLIHIDPWKKYQDLNEGIQWTIDMINFCYQLNPNIEYEIGTEEAIRPFTVDELEIIIIKLKNSLCEDVFNKIKYCVIQCGNKLLAGKNIGMFDEDKLKQMITLVKKYNFISKEHNGDWVSLDIIKEKNKLGLECINIAPEFGMIETEVMIDHINNEHFEKMYELCLQSGKWKKWVDYDFDYINKKKELILITGHYIFSYDEFIELKQCYENIDEAICEKIKNKLLLLNFIYEERIQCIFCNSVHLTTIFEKNYKTSLSLSLFDKNHTSYFMPYNILLCNQCNTAQNKYLGDLTIVYENNHMDNFGDIKNKKHTLLSDFISENKSICNIIEVGACHNYLASLILEKNNVNYTIIEPSFSGDKTNINIIPEYFENVDLTALNSDTIIMSDVFEHFYKPLDILKKIKDSNIKYIYLNHPDFDYSIQNNIHINLNCEHTFLIEHQFLFQLFNNFGFRMNRRFNFENFSLFIEFIKMDEPIITRELLNYNTREHTHDYMKYIIDINNKINNHMLINQNKKYYIWPTSAHSQTLFTFGLNYKQLSGILDNSPNKIGKYMYGLLCSSLNDLLESNEDNICVFISGAGNYIKELNLSNTTVELIVINEL